jgi:expansin (peptidoglycan-binding protein)
MLTFTLVDQGKTAKATITDRCEGCIGASIDMSPSLFQKFADLSVGRLHDVKWTYD